MDWLRDGWETQWIHTRNWPGSITPEELQKRLKSMEKIGKTPCGAGKQAMQHMTLYLQELTLSQFAGAKWEAEHLATSDKDTAVYYNLLYNADLSKYLEAYLHHPAPVDEREINDLTLHATAFLIDQTKLVLKSLAETSKIEHRKVSHAIHLLRTVCVAVDKRTPYHEQHSDLPLPEWLPAYPFRRFTDASRSMAMVSVQRPHDSPASDSSLSLKMADLSVREESPEIVEVQKGNKFRSSDCRPGMYLRVRLLLEHFGNGSAISGFQLLVNLLYATVSQKVTLELGEVILRFVSIAVDFLKDHKKNMFLAPCMDILRHVYACYASQRLEKISLSTVTMIMNHLRLIFQSLLPHDTALQLTQDMQKRQRDQFFQFLLPVQAPTPTTEDSRSSRRGR